MGFMVIHNPDALHHCNGFTYCPWCGKEGQNEGTVVNHQWMMHYRLGLVCDKCYDYPSTSSDTLCHHGWQNCPPLMSQLHQSNYQQRTGRINLSSLGI